MMIKSNKSYSFLMFAIGLFSMTQINIIGSIGISELCIFIVAPYIYFSDMQILRRHGFMPALWLILLSMVGCAVSSLYNDIPFAFFIRGMASTYSVFASMVVYHRVISKNPDGIKWMLLGFCLTQVLNTFIFQTSVEAHLYADGATGVAAAEGIMSSPIYWIQRIGGFVALPYQGWYLSTPIVYSVFAPIVSAVFYVLTSTSGRSAALGVLGASAIMFIGQKSLRKMRSMEKKFIFYMILAIFAVMGANLLYKYAATAGLMGEKSQKKYEEQTRGGTSVIRLLVSGRTATFMGLYACLKQPIFGYGPWAIDKTGIVDEFYFKYASPEEYAEVMQNAIFHRVQYVPAHSHIIGSWVSNGILGLFFWIYFLFKIFEHCRHYVHVIPQWFGVLAAGIPAMLWNVIFSPFSGRPYFSFFFTLLLLSCATGRGTWRISPLMGQTIFKMQRKERLV